MGTKYNPAVEPELPTIKVSNSAHMLVDVALESLVGVMPMRCWEIFIRDMTYLPQGV
jgi:hypothetical protein